MKAETGLPLPGFRFTGQRRLSRAHMLHFLDEMGHTSQEIIRTLYIPGGTAPERINAYLSDMPGVPEELPGIAAASPTGAVIFSGGESCRLLLPPFPVSESISVAGLAVEPLRLMLRRDYTIALVLVRLGAYAVGVCVGDTIKGSKVGTGLVHARHKKGGSSQARFRRHREKQIEQFLIRVCGHAREQIEPYGKSVDFMVYGGARTTILLLQKECPFLMQFDDRLLPPLLDIAEPRRPVLEAALSRVWSSSLTEWRRE